MDVNKNTTGTSIPHADKQKIKNYLFALPDKKIIKKFDNTVGTIIYKIITNKNEIITISHIRDSLLPKLMSGKLRIPVQEN